MADLQPTPAQDSAIRSTQRSILVSAGAGSGKTAVLAERCAHLVADATPPCPVDSLLVVTFTEAATAEMRRRIEAVLRERQIRAPSSRWLQEQIALLDTASIHTIHGFCRSVLTRYFAQADLDPQTPVLDAQDAQLLRRETAHAVIDRLADVDGPAGEAFRDLLACYAGPHEQRLLEAALGVHAFLTSIADPQEWLQATLDRFELTEGRPAPFWIEALAKRLQDELRDQSLMLAEFLSPIECESYPFTVDFAMCIGDYREHIERWRWKLGQRPTSDDLESVCAEISEYQFCKFPRRSQKTDASVSPAFERCKLHAETARNELFTGRLKKIYGPFRTAAARDGILKTHTHLQVFVKLIQAIAKDYEAAKRDQGVVDFSDLERLCLKLLRDDANGVARRLRDKYRVVLVDEFQDVNPVQEEILRLVSRENDPEREANLFAVGDVKQSIYRFRLAEPALFIQRQRSFPRISDAPSDARGVTVDLRENFRSRPGVIDAINRVFERIMSADLGGIEYDEHARLVATKPADPNQTPPFELHLLAPPPRSDAGSDQGAGAQGADPDATDALNWEQVEREAHLIADRIQALIAEGRRYGEIIILLRSLQARAGLFIRTLVRGGVPVFAESAGGIFESLEVMDILALLHLLDNARQDIPLAALLRSPLMGAPLSDDDMAEIRIASRRIDRHMPYHQAARWYAKEGPRDDLRSRLHALFVRLSDWRQRIRRRPLADVLWEIYDETGYLAYVSGTREGPQRRANLLRLHEYARQFGSFTRQGLYRFLRFVEALRDADQDLDPGSVSASSQDVVRLMSIHKSKGLEFPIVILAELGKRFNLADAQGGILYDRNLGLALDAVDLQKRIRYPTLPHQLVRQAILKESRSEELRVLYVALTRAQGRLILVGTGDIDRFHDAHTRYAHHVGPLPLLERQTALSFQDWVIDAIACQEEPVVTIDSPPQPSTRFSITTYSLEQMKSWVMDKPEPAEGRATLERFTRLEPIAAASPSAEAAAILNAVTRRLITPYPAAVLSEIPSVVAASVLKRRWDASIDPEEPLASATHVFDGVSNAHFPHFPPPVFLRPSDAADPTQVGTWTHEFLQHIDLTLPCTTASLNTQRSAAVATGRFTSDVAKHIDIDALAWFFQSDLAKRLCSAHRVLREWPFVLGVEPARINPAAASLATPQDVVLVRGMIDCLFEAGGGWEIIDYKTDAIAETAARVEEYRGQLAIYASAVEATWVKPPTREWLVFLHPRQIVEIRA